MNQPCFTSSLHQLGVVTFPPFTGEKIYMHAFTKAGGLPVGLQRWQDTVDQMLDGVDAPDLVYLMVDQALVQSGTNHRRPGPHVDGYWNPNIQGQPNHGGHRLEGSDEELLLLATNVLGCEAYVGHVMGMPGAGGDCTELDLSGLNRVDLAPGRVWSGHTLSMLHASLPVVRDSLRTVVRLNVPYAQPLACLRVW